MKVQAKRKVTATIPDPPVPLADNFRWHAAGIALLVLIAYSNSLGSSFHFDDGSLFVNPGVSSPGFGWDLFRLDQTRPLTYLTFHWNYLLGGQDPLFYHWVNLLLHAANSILLLAVARKYLSPFVAGCVAVLFALHPLQTESVTYVFSRSTLLSTHFALWTMWFYARKKYWRSALLFGVSLLAKEETIALPGFLLLLHWFERRRPRIGYFAILGGFAALAAGRLFYLIHVSPIDPGIGRVHGIGAGIYLLTQFRVLWIYLRLLLAPFGLNLLHQVAWSASLWSPWTTLPAVISLAAAVAGLVWLTREKHSAPALWALGFFVLIAPSSSIVAQADAMYEHRTYLPMVAMAIALGYLLERVPRAKLGIAIAVLIPVMLAGTIWRNEDWRDEKTLWADIVRKSPTSGKSWLGLSRAYQEDPSKAREYLSMGLSVDPDNAELHNNYGIMLMATGDSSAALAQFQRALALSEETADRWNNIAGAYYRMGNVGASLKSFQRALQLDPCSFNVRRNLMMLYAQRNDPNAVWRAGEIPASCRMIPDQAAELAELRRRAGPVNRGGTVAPRPEPRGQR